MFGALLVLVFFGTVFGEHGHAHAHEHHGHSHEGHSHGHHAHAEKKKPVPPPPSDKHHGHSHGHSHAPHGRSAGKAEPAPRSVWTNAILATVLVGCAPVVILLFLPPLTSNSGGLLKVLLGFAAGGLLGDVFLHLLPHALDPHDHSDSHHHGGGHDHSRGIYVGLYLLAGLLVFFAIEKWVRSKAASYGGDKHSHSHSHTHTHNDDPAAKKKGTKEKKSSIAGVEVAGWLNLVADFSHNFTDGLAIGASFLVSDRVGMVTTVAVLIHEVPHEIGDYAILIKSGMSRRAAMLSQLLTAVGCLAGTILGLAAHGIADSSAWILPFTAGGFVYIACTTVLPDLLDDNSSLLQSVGEILGLIVGIMLMVLVAFLE
jgi:zinc transporter 7